MDISLDKVAIVGAGAIGGWLGAGLAGAGCQVSLLARGETLAALRRDGLRLQHGPADAPVLTTHAVQASDAPQALGPQDLVIVAVKAPAMVAVAPLIGPLLGPDTIVLPAMNGVPWWFLQDFGGPLAGSQLESVDPGGAIGALVPAQRIVGCVVHASCSVVAPGVVRHGFGKRLILGEPGGERSPRAQALVQLLVRAGFDAELSTTIQQEIWFKLWGNMTMNPVSALTGADSHRILDDPLVRGFCANVMREARDIGERLGIRIDQQPEDRHAVTRKLGAFKTSMLQDVEAGKQVELDALVGAVRELGVRTGVPTPWTDALLGLSRLHARVRGLY
ncbi:MAG: 2-dehydropantoate 2-reductase [Rhodoferax sp.]